MEKYADLLQSIETFALLAEAEKVYGPYTRHDKRQIVIIQDDKGKSRTVSYPKYLVEQHLGRKLLPNETIDHWDSNIDNNNLDNLKVIDRAEHSKQDTRRVRLLDLECKLCGKHFMRSPRLLRDKSKKGNSGPFCSRQCSGRYNRRVQLKLMDKLPVQDHVPSQYYKAKYEVKASQGMDKHEELAWKLRARIEDTIKTYASFNNGDVGTPRFLGKEDDKDVLEISIGALSYKDEKGPFYAYARLHVYPDGEVAVKTDQDFPSELLLAIQRSIKEVRAEFKKQAFIDYLFAKYAIMPRQEAYAQKLREHSLATIKNYASFEHGHVGNVVPTLEHDEEEAYQYIIMVANPNLAVSLQTAYITVLPNMIVRIEATPGFPPELLDGLQDPPDPQSLASIEHLFEKYAKPSQKQYASKLAYAIERCVRDYDSFEGGTVERPREAREGNEIIWKISVGVVVHLDSPPGFNVSKYRLRSVSKSSYTIATVYPDLSVRVSHDDDFPPELLDCIEQAKQATYQELTHGLDTKASVKNAGMNAPSYAHKLRNKLLEMLPHIPAFGNGQVDPIHKAVENDEHTYEILIAAPKDPSKKKRWAGDSTYAILTVFPELDVRIGADPDFPPELLEMVEQARQAIAP